MQILDFNLKPCERSRRHLDNYLSNELTVETRYKIRRHLERCLGCTMVLENRAQAKNLLQRAVSRQDTPNHLATKIQRRLRAYQKADN